MKAQTKAVMLLLCLLAGCAGDQANHQSSTFRDLRIDTAGTEHADRATDARAGAEEAFRSGLARVEARQDATQQSMSGIGAQIREVRTDVEALAKISMVLQPDIKAEVRNEMRVSAAANAMAIAQTEARLDARLELNTKVEALTSAVATLTANVEAMAQAQASAQVGIGNEMRSSISELKATAGRDVNTTQFSQEMAGVYERFIGAFVWSGGIVAVVAIGVIAAAAFILVRSKEDSRARASERELKLLEIMGGRSRSRNGRIDSGPHAPVEVMW